MSDFKALALQHSATCFLNALFREDRDHRIQDKAIWIPLSADQEIMIPLKKESLLGRHQYTHEFFLVERGSKTALSFIELVEHLSQKLAQPYEFSTEKAALFVQRVANSVRNMELALKAREPDIRELYRQKISFRQAEQGLMIGHNFHPYPKTREGFDDADYKTYSPEMAGEFSLSWFWVKPEILHNQTAQKFSQKEWLWDLYRADYGTHQKPPEGFIPFPVHSWQKQHLLKNATVQKHFNDGLIQDGGLADKKWYPTSSLRSVYAPHAEYMLKFSLTLRLTNSIRHLTNVEVVRGLQVYDVFATSQGQDFLKEFPQFQIVFEPAFAALKDEEGAVIASSIVVARENPFKTPDPTVENIVLSTLAQDHPLGGENLILSHARATALMQNISLKQAALQWFKEYLHVAVKPLIVAQAKYGILLGAHQQNLILSLKAHRPMKAYFRDCQGTGYSEQGYEFYHRDVALLVKENGNILDGKGNILFGYYLIVNSTFNVITALAESGEVCEGDLIHALRDFLITLKAQNYADESFFDYLLTNPRIYQKGNFHCSLQNLNENTVANPLAIYNLINNPLYQEEVL